MGWVVLFMKRSFDSLTFTLDGFPLLWLYEEA